MRRFLDTSSLVTYSSGRYKGKINWLANVGKELYFEYDELNGNIKILSYEKGIPQGKITLQYKNNILTTYTPVLLHLKCPSLFNMEKQSNKYKYLIGDIIIHNKDRLLILSQERILYNNSSARGYLIECLDCHYQYTTREDKMSSCPVCGERSTYSERFVYSMLKYANIKFTAQKEFLWLPNRWYDIYLPNDNAIIEVNGIQHYTPTKINVYQNPEQTYRRNLYADKVKQSAALVNGYKYYIINACNRNNLYYEIINTLNFIDFENVSNIECEKFANLKLIKRECDLWNQGYSLEEIAEKTKRSTLTVQSKLRLGNKESVKVFL